MLLWFVEPFHFRLFHGNPLKLRPARSPAGSNQPADPSPSKIHLALTQKNALLIMFPRGSSSSTNAISIGSISAVVLIPGPAKLTVAIRPLGTQTRDSSNRYLAMGALKPLGAGPIRSAPRQVLVLDGRRTVTRAGKCYAVDQKARERLLPERLPALATAVDLCAGVDQRHQEAPARRVGICAGAHGACLVII